MSRHRGYGGDVAKASARERLASLAMAIPALILPLIIVMGVRFGVFTATEAGAIAFAYAIFCGALLYRELTPTNLLAAIRESVFDTVLSGLVFCSVTDPGQGLREVRRVLRPNGQLRMLEHVRATRAWKARLQDLLQPAWTRVTGGCHPNRETERAVEAAGFRIDVTSRRAKGEMRRFAARPAA